MDDAAKLMALRQACNATKLELRELAKALGPDEPDLEGAGVGFYQVVDKDSNVILAGENGGITLEEVERFIANNE